MDVFTGAYTVAKITVVDSLSKYYIGCLKQTSTFYWQLFRRLHYTIPVNA